MDFVFWYLKHFLRQRRNELRSTLKAPRVWWRFWTQVQEYGRLAQAAGTIPIRKWYPCLDDLSDETPVDPTYFYQDAWAFEKVVQQRPAHHVDVGSHHKYVALLSKVVPVTMVDIRPLPTPLNSLQFQAGTILDLPFPDQSLPSVSSMCVIEHIGLGRYGDPLDPLGTEKALSELKRVIMPGGDLYLSVPLDDENRIYFNAHRAFTEPYLLSLFAPFRVIEKRYIYGYRFGDALQRGFGTGCYHLRRLNDD